MHKKWLIALIGICGTAALAEFGYLMHLHQQDLDAHAKKMSYITTWKDDMIKTAPRARKQIAELEGIDRDFLNLISAPADTQRLIASIASHWDVRALRRSLDVLPVLQDGTAAKTDLLALVAKKTRPQSASFDETLSDWYQYLWDQEKIHQPKDPSYADFRAVLYRDVDPHFAMYFGNDRLCTPPISQIRWLGIPHRALKVRTQTDRAADDSELPPLADADEIVIAERQHEELPVPLARLKTAGPTRQDFAGGHIMAIFCPSKNAVSLFYLPPKSPLFSPSAFAYKGDWLLVDDKTQSLWSSTTGEAIAGPAAATGEKLEMIAGRAGKWGQWKAAHKG